MSNPPAPEALRSQEYAGFFKRALKCTPRTILKLGNIDGVIAVERERPALQGAGAIGDLHHLWIFERGEAAE